MTEYDIPIDTKIVGVSSKGAECEFDPVQVFEVKRDGAVIVR
jgi:hypothetical protein